MAIPTTTNWVTTEGWAPTCAFETYPGSQRWMEPPEFCDNEPIEGDEFCELHTEQDPDDDDEPHYGPFAACYEADMDAA